jgi:hypothetical protein
MIELHKMLEPIPRYSTRASIDCLTAALGLTGDYGMQDWSYEIAEPEDIQKYLDHYESITNEDDKFVLMEMIIQATEYQRNDQDFAKYCSIVKDLLIKDFAIHQYTIYYWAAMDQADLSDSWKIAPLMREIWHNHEVTTNSYRRDFDTSYHQFYILDKDSPSDTDSNTFWTEESHQDRLAIGTNILGVSTGCYGDVKSLIKLLEIEPVVELDKYDHIVEASIFITSGILQIIPCVSSDDAELELKLPIGEYCIRINSGNLASVVGDEGEDFYVVQIWPSEKRKRNVLKRFST